MTRDIFDECEQVCELHKNCESQSSVDFSSLRAACENLHVYQAKVVLTEKNTYSRPTSEESGCVEVGNLNLSNRMIGHIHKHSERQNRIFCLSSRFTCACINFRHGQNATKT